MAATFGLQRGGSALGRLVVVARSAHLVLRTLFRSPSGAFGTREPQLAQERLGTAVGFHRSPRVRPTGVGEPTSGAVAWTGRWGPPQRGRGQKPDFTQWLGDAAARFDRAVPRRRGRPLTRRLGRAVTPAPLTGL